MQCENTKHVQLKIVNIASRISKDSMHSKVAIKLKSVHFDFELP